jgi:hypothetical protein
MFGSIAQIIASSAIGQASTAFSVCFTPEEDCAAFATRAIDDARHEILVGAYRLTTGTGIVEALVRAKARGVAIGRR